MTELLSFTVLTGGEVFGQPLGFFLFDLSQMCCRHLAQDLRFCQQTVWGIACCIKHLSLSVLRAAERCHIIVLDCFVFIGFHRTQSWLRQCLGRMISNRPLGRRPLKRRCIRALLPTGHSRRNSTRSDSPTTGQPSKPRRPGPPNRPLRAQRRRRPLRRPSRRAWPRRPRPMANTRPQRLRYLPWPQARSMHQQTIMVAGSVDVPLQHLVRHSRLRCHRDLRLQLAPDVQDEPQ